jgi:ribosome-associated toxin RatA of RatAB toxin-antitoxin module|tara:strand:+ start:8943 stop:9377 length:435 start_codon:yes stop_codon:yes gene_type:complete
MSNLEFTEILEIEKENIMTACQEYEKYPEYLPDQLPSVKIIKNDSHGITTEETIALRTLVKNEIKQSSFHQKINQNMLKTTIISGPAKNSIIEITFEELSDSKTKVHVSIDLKLTFAAKFLSPIFKVWYKRILLAILYKMMNNK